MNSFALCSLNSLLRATAVLAGGALLFVQAEAALPDPCSLVTAAEMQAIVGKLSGTPKATDPASGEVTCSFEPVSGPSFIDVSLHDGDLKAWKARNGGKTPVSLPELGADAFANPSDNDWVDLYAKKGAVIVRVTMPTGPKSMDMAKAIAKTALSRL
jgi:hypothetical protein